MATAGALTPLAFAGSHVEGLAPLSLFAPQSASGQALPLAARANAGQASSWATLDVTDLPIVVESSSSTAANLPAAFCGALSQAGEQDQFEFTAAKGAALSFRAVTKSA